MSGQERLTDLQERLDAKTRLMQDVAHELKNPMSVIHGYAAFLMRENVNEHEQRKAFQAILLNVERAIAMIENLQDAVRLETGGFPVKTRIVEGVMLLQDAVQSAELEATRRGLRLRWRSPVDDPLFVVADPKRIAQILANLIGNALKFTPEGGLIDVHAQRDGLAIRFSVVDTGPGVPPHELPHLFDRFHQAGDSAMKSLGLGLGLSICKGLVEAHGGRIWVESPPGSGAAFHFTLPALGSRTSDSSTT